MATPGRTPDASPPEAIGPPELELAVPAEQTSPTPAVPRLIRAVVVGLMFSVFPVLLTNLVLTRGESRFDPQALAAAIPVLAVSLALSRPRDRWYAVGPQGFAMGERYFGQVRWDVFGFDTIEAVKVEARRRADGAGGDPGAGYRVVFDGEKRKRVVLEGQVDEAAEHGNAVRLPDDTELPEAHELRAIRAAVTAWKRATGRTPSYEGVEPITEGDRA